LGGGEASYRPLNRLPPASVSTTASATRDGDEIKVHVQIENHGAAAALANKLTLESASDGSRILPAYLSDNYCCRAKLGRSKLNIRPNAAHGPAKLEIRGWNLPGSAIPVLPSL
jgi:Ig-like domain-containing protein